MLWPFRDGPVPCMGQCSPHAQRDREWVRGSSLKLRAKRMRKRRGGRLLSLGGSASVGLTGISCVTSKGHMGRPGSVPACGKGMAAVFSGCTREKG